VSVQENAVRVPAAQGASSRWLSATYDVPDLWTRAAAVLLAVAAFCIALIPINTIYLWDEAVYLADAETLADTAPYYSEAWYRPPLLPLLLHAGSLVFDLDAFAHVVTSAFFALAVVMLFLAGRELYDGVSGFFAAVLMLLSPFFLHWSTKVMTDIPCLALALASVYFLARHARREKRALSWRAAIAGLLMGLAVLMRFPAILLLAVPGVLVLMRVLRLPAAAVFAGGFSAALAPYFAWAQVRHGHYLQPFREAMTIVAGSEAVNDVLYYVKATYLVAGPATLLALVIYLYASTGPGRSWLRQDLPLLFWFVVVTAYLTSSSHKELRYAMLAVPPLFLLAGRALASVRVRRQAIVLAAVVLVVAVHPFRQWQRFSGMMDIGEEYLLQYAGQTRASVGVLRAHLRPGEVIYANAYYPVIGYYSKRPTKAAWPWDERFYDTWPQSMKVAGLLVHYRQIDRHPTEAWLNRTPAFRKIHETGRVVVYRYDVPR